MILTVEGDSCTGENQSMSQHVTEKKPVSMYTFVAAHATLLWRVVASIGLIALAVVISS